METVETVKYKGHTINIIPDEIVDNPREFYDHLGTLKCFHSRYALSDDGYNDDNPEDFLRSLAEEISQDCEDTIYELEDGDEWGRLYEKYGYDKAVQISEEQIQKIIEQTIEDEYIILDVYMYDHSGIILNTDGFSCHWDSSKIGFIYVSKDDVEKKYGKIDDETIELVKRILKSEIQEFSDYVSGNVYGYTIDNPDGNETDFSCWGFFGDWETSGLIDHAKSDINSAKEQ